MDLSHYYIMTSTIPTGANRRERVEWYNCIHCGLLDDYDASQVCRDCMAIIAHDAENLFLLDLLRAAYAELEDSKLRRKIGRIITIVKVMSGRSGNKARAPSRWTALVVAAASFLLEEGCRSLLF